MNEILGLFKNVKGGPVTSIIGGTLMLFAGFMMYKTGFYFYLNLMMEYRIRDVISTVMIAALIIMLYLVNKRSEQRKQEIISLKKDSIDLYIAYAKSEARLAELNKDRAAIADSIKNILKDGKVSKDERDNIISSLVVYDN